ncbi:MAG: hypothetical protein II881_02965 [Oscillospiraceae bacterium]|nr:hypothetical protein [Oscillospiraceae bacterium]
MNVRKRIDYSDLYVALDIAINADLEQMDLYLKIGKAICSRPEKGAAVAAAEYIAERYPEIQGFSPRNVRRMRSFYATFNSEEELLCSAKKIGWSQIVIILEADLTLDEKKWYIHAAKQLGWSRNELGEKISNSAINEIIIDFTNNYCYNNAEITELESRYFGDCSEDDFKEIAHKERAVSIQNTNSNLSELFLREIIYDKQVGKSMKIILSRKGFDSSNGGCPSPILPDGTLLSIPIPSNDSVSFKDLGYRDINYSDLLSQLNPKKTYLNCHLDPDIRENVRLTEIADWKPAFGQIGSAQGLLKNAKVEIGDIFLFFGWFKRIEQYQGKYRYARKNAEDFYNGSDLQIIYGYLQVGEIITDPKRIADYYWHPHSSSERINNLNNALYVPAERLSFLPDYKGFGVLNYREDRVLTMKNKSRGVWSELEFLYPEHVYGNKKNSAKGEGLYYSGIWQELVVFETAELIEWAKSIIK